MQTNEVCNRLTTHTAEQSTHFPVREALDPIRNWWQLRTPSPHVGKEAFQPVGGHVAGKHPPARLYRRSHPACLQCHVVRVTTAGLEAFEPFVQMSGQGPLPLLKSPINDPGLLVFNPLQQ